jgi:hypothetical protein
VYNILFEVSLDQAINGETGTVVSMDVQCASLKQLKGEREISRSSF